MDDDYKFVRDCPDSARPWVIPESGRLLTVTSQFIRDRLTRFGHVGPIKSVLVTLRFALHGATVRRDFYLSEPQWKTHIVPLHDVAKDG